MKPLTLCLLLGLYLSLALLAGCARHHTNSRTAQLLDDKVITERVEASLKHASTNAFAEVQVTTTNAVVTLSGFVPNAAAKAKASQVASGVQRVRKVENMLRIHPQAHSRTLRDLATWLSRRQLLECGSLLPLWDQPQVSGNVP